MTGWDDILLTLTERNQSETQIKDFFKGDDICCMYGKMIGRRKTRYDIQICKSWL